MKKEEFIRFVKEIGIDNIEKLGIYVGKLCKTQYYTGIYFNDDEWIVYGVDERNNSYVLFKGAEEVAFDRLFRKLLVRLRMDGYVNQSVTKNIIKTTRTDVVKFLCSKYFMDEQEANSAWNFLAKDFRVLNELKYYVVNEAFVPDQDAYVVEGYTAKKLHEKFGLDALQSFTRLLHLKLDPERTLKKLITKTRYYKFKTGNGAVRRTGPIIEYLDQNGNWVINGELIRMFVGGDTDFYEISEEEAEQLAIKKKNINSN